MFGVAAGVAPPYPNSFHWSMPMSSITINRILGNGACAALTGRQTSATPASATNDASVTTVRRLNGSDESIGDRCLPFTNVGVLLGRTIYVSSCGEIGPCMHYIRRGETSPVVKLDQPAATARRGRSVVAVSFFAAERLRGFLALVCSSCPVNSITDSIAASPRR